MNRLANNDRNRILFIADLLQKIAKYVFRPTKGFVGSARDPAIVIYCPSVFLHPAANHPGQKDKDDPWEPDPDEFTLQYRPPPGAEEGLDPHRRNLYRPPWKEVPFRRKGRKEGDSAAPVCQGIEEAVARPDKEKNQKEAKPPAGKECLIPEEEKHQEKANKQAQERGVKKSTVAKRRVIPEVKQERIQIREDGNGDCYRPVADRRMIRAESNA
jgi:hypothetical protein